MAQVALEYVSSVIAPKFVRVNVNFPLNGEQPHPPPPHKKLRNFHFVVKIRKENESLITLIKLFMIR